ncbi:hypothetical protein [Aliikangiella sp. G2MR2-5]|uniref:hypothetical protein n=1 Tax=Aliikangiella sp. G2MR2-5 TaxID=2788943 RepID=UPI0018A9619C|nr:hypothetical protein [Aliikangiella sp. G2MR2-5]
MKWYTIDNGRLCLGTQSGQYANFHVATDVVLSSPITTPLLPEHVELIGSYPEDWFNDNDIDSKINKIAKHYFGLNKSSLTQLTA